jgi:hypothetical protein
MESEPQIPDDCFVVTKHSTLPVGKIRLYNENHVVHCFSCVIFINENRLTLVQGNQHNRDRFAIL